LIVLMFVDLSMTLGAFPALKASCHLRAHKHHLSPGFRPLHPY